MQVALLLLATLGVALAKDGDRVNDRVGRSETVSDFLSKNGYPFEEHVAETTDGYLLTMHRIPRPGAPVVVLQHGILGDSWNFLINTDERSIAQTAWRAGYDVWLLNNRGSTYGLQHTFLERRSKEFWNFSFAEMGRYDLPAQIGKVKAITGVEKVSYLGCQCFQDDPSVCTSAPQSAVIAPSATRSSDQLSPNGSGAISAG